MFPKSFRTLKELLESLPQIGSKTAERLAAHIVKMPLEEKKNLARAILSVSKLKECPRCFNFSEDKLCVICKDKTRKQEVIAVVETPLHIAPFEKAGYRGSYHVLGGLIASFLEDPDSLRLTELLKRIKKEKPRELILALDASLEGETTAIYVAKEIEKSRFRQSRNRGSSISDKVGASGPFPKTKISRLAQGLPTGADLEYADEITIREALRGRRQINE